MIPFVGFVEWPQNTNFYIFVFATIPLVYFADMRSFSLFSKFGAGPVSRIHALKSFVLFLIWGVVNPDSILNYFHQPFTGGGIILSIIICVFFSSKLRVGNIDKQVTSAMLPVVICFAIVDVLNKSSMDIASNTGGVFAYIFIQSLFIVLAFGIMRFLKKDVAVVKIAIDKRYIKGSFLLCLFFFCVMVLKNFAFMQAPNPAYVTVIMLLSPIWVTSFNKITKYPDKTNIRAGLGVVFGIVMLTLLTI